ncbi:MAG: type II toxin-antitoxin system HicA family toxin [Verrucomicrobiota bacterium]
MYRVYFRPVTSRGIISKLKADGWELANVRGSHHQYKHHQRSGRVTVPHPKKDFPRGTLRSIFHQAGWPWPP